jgi:hypothetical protein
LKKNHIASFTAGIIIGGAIMSMIWGSSQFIHLIHPKPASSPTSIPAQLPYVIALESTGVSQAITPTFIAPTLTTEPKLPSRQTSVRPTSTPLLLLNDQRLEVIGYSVEGRPLEVYAFGNGEQERMIVAGIHGGDEWNTITLANQLIQYLNQNRNIIPESVTVYILPNLNPDGEARSHNKYGRLNHNGVDLNRNFPVNWKMDWDRSGCWNTLPTSGGTAPGSEVESQTLMDFITKHNVQVLISYHSAALGIFPGGLPWDEDSIRLAEALAQVSSYPFPPIDTGCMYSGTLADYAVSAGIAAVDLELTNHFDTDFDQNLQVLDVLLNYAP